MKLGKGVIEFENPPAILGYASVAGQKENEGPLAGKFDQVCNGDTDGEDSFEKAESKMQSAAAHLAIQKAGLQTKDIDVVFAGDLLNQCIGSNYGLREMNIPFAGLYGACSTMAESMVFASLMVAADYADHALAITSSHFCASERQFRFPLEYGGQRPPTAQWTATASGAVLLGKTSSKTQVKSVCIGKIVDMGVTDINNMGAAMAPAAADTLIRFFKASQTAPQDYDMILTGDLGEVGSTLLNELMDREGLPMKGRHSDCGMLLYDRKAQDVHAGGSGCGCSAAVLCADMLKRLEEGKLKRILFAATGALMSTTANQQGESIPGISHLVLLQGDH